MTTRPAHQFQPDGQQAPIEALPDPPKKPDAMQQLSHIARINLVLESYFRGLGRTDVLVNGEGYLCFNTRSRTNLSVPDCVVAFGVDPEAITERNGYVIDEVGKPPEFVLEVASESTARLDYTVKPGIYAQFGIDEYWRFDRTGGRLHQAPLGGGRLVDGAYLPIEMNTSDEGVIWGHSEVLGLDLCWDRGRLRVWEPVSREYLPDLQEALAQRDAAISALGQIEARANNEAARANSEAQRADSAEAEIQRLREELRRHGEG
jgi:hypothetical protein